MVLDPDEAVVEAIATVFRRFDELGLGPPGDVVAARDGLLLPRRPRAPGGSLGHAATYPAVHDFLTNPSYAGAFVFGRTRTDKRLDATGRLVSAPGCCPVISGRC